MRTAVVLVFVTLLSGPAAAQTNARSRVEWRSDDFRSASPYSGSNRVHWFERSNLLRSAEGALQQGRPEKAVDFAERAMNLVLDIEERGSALNTLCVAYTRLSQYDTALIHCDQLVATYPPNWKVYNNRANAYLQSGRTDEAIADYELALERVGPVTAESRVLSLDAPERVVVREVLESNLALARLRRAAGLSGVEITP